MFADIIATTTTTDRVSKEIFSGSQQPSQKHILATQSQTHPKPYESQPLIDSDAILEAPFLNPDDPIPKSHLAENLPISEEVIPPEPKEGEAEEKSWRNRLSAL